MSVDALKAWLKGDTTKPIADHVAVDRQKITRAAFSYVPGPFVKGYLHGRCNQCLYTSGDAPDNCGLFRMLNQRQEDDFDLDPKVDPRGRCNAYTPSSEHSPHDR